MRILVTGHKGFIGSAVFESLSQSGKTVIGADLPEYNLTNEADVKKLFSKLGRVDVLINCFAKNDHLKDVKFTTLLDFTIDAFREYMETNVTALFSVCREYARSLIGDKGKIINFSSIYGAVSPDPSLYGGGEKDIAYGVSKGAVEQLTRHLAVHLAPFISVNAIRLGGVYNDHADVFRRKYCSKVPLGRMARIDDVIGILNFLCSESSSYCTGSIFTVDGGYTAL